MGEVIPFRTGTGPVVDELGDGPDILGLTGSWRLALDQEEKSPGTIRSYLDTVAMTAAWLARRDRCTCADGDEDEPAVCPVGATGSAGEPSAVVPDVEHIGTEHLRAYLLHRKRTTSPGTAAKDFRNLRVFFGWCVAEGERTPPSPMDRVKKVEVAAKAQPIFSDEELAALLKTCSGNSFEDRRDHAILRVLMDNGVRVSGLAGLRYAPDDAALHDVHLGRRLLRVRSKGGREFWAPIGKKSAVALDRYIRVRKRHKHADSPWLWLPLDSRTTAAGEHRLLAHGIAQMIERRGAECGLAATPHKFRRTMASTWEGDVVTLMGVGGWESLEMAKHYGRVREERAREAHARLSPGDRI
ncbi:tyrosine-type recombinase/integrase [Actinomadura rubrisoli]|uniref:Integrase n=1 Tax=Actinomadura rubrisoli TaxID=2530368 RepID=A0A4R5B364_9ACTN|nr:tyrosine-type recombinase/integrase [Actinomadura rubrisoli]TDD79625.1 integrase [Actinomadura rubrisoli]